MGILAKMRHYANINVLTKLYYAIIYPFLIYGLLAWGSAYLTTLKSIVILQKKAVRIITSSKHDAHTSVLFHQLSILKLSDLVSMHTALFMFDFYHNTIPSSFSNFFTSIRKVHNYRKSKLQNRKSRHSFLKLTSKIRVSQNYKRHYQTLAFASRWLIS